MHGEAENAMPSPASLARQRHNKCYTLQWTDKNKNVIITVSHCQQQQQRVRISRLNAFYLLYKAFELHFTASKSMKSRHSVASSKILNLHL